MECRSGCGACCIAPSISGPLPGMPNGKPAGAPCAQLMADMRCAIFGQPERPAVCASFKAMNDVCGESKDQAIWLISELEKATS
ncbi:YkgJ family cysteine cluster protein [Oceanisphaera pacifica]|uniref:YkgJ family cysteine cluster protein n=1 Tax=Oceanisphaera pacifica TaxID=2818389 RepID=A0ABS3NGE9_9GAMM|nr:YkgJ family cysteine cluster protein [Oceanisphaera pacifica]MBO1519620.1 YkgJ family cysteine cluster protein [Oceanisphaera pacifica]